MNPSAKNRKIDENCAASLRGGVILCACVSGLAAMAGALSLSRRHAAELFCVDPKNAAAACDTVSSVAAAYLNSKTTDVEWDVDDENMCVINLEASCFAATRTAEKARGNTSRSQPARNATKKLRTGHAAHTYARAAACGRVYVQNGGYDNDDIATTGRTVNRLDFDWCALSARLRCHCTRPARFVAG